MWTIYKLWKTNEHTILKLWTLIKNIIERTQKFPYNILFTFLMDRGRAPNGIGHLMILLILEPTTVGSLWLENDLHENELEFESYMGRSKKNVRVTSDGIHAEIHEIWTCVAPAAPPLFHAAVNPCLQGESPWNWSCNSVNLRKGTVTWMRRHYVFTVISRWSTFSSTVNVCSINCVIFSDTHCSFGPPILWHSPFHAGVSVY